MSELLSRPRPACPVDLRPGAFATAFAATLLVNMLSFSMGLVSFGCSPDPRCAPTMPGWFDPALAAMVVGTVLSWLALLGRWLWRWRRFAAIRRYDLEEDARRDAVMLARKWDLPWPQ